MWLICVHGGSHKQTMLTLNPKDLLNQLPRHCISPNEAMKSQLETVWCFLLRLSMIINLYIYISYIITNDCSSRYHPCHHSLILKGTGNFIVRNVTLIGHLTISVFECGTSTSTSPVELSATLGMVYPLETICCSAQVACRNSKKSSSRLIGKMTEMQTN